jgi:hypothetical protein
MGKVRIVSNPRSCSAFVDVADDLRSWVIHLNSLGRFSPWSYLPLDNIFFLIWVCHCGCRRGPDLNHSRSSRYMLSRGCHTTIFIISMFILLLMKYLLAKFIISCKTKDERARWLCLVKGYLASLHDLVSFQIEHTKCSRMRSVTKQIIIDRLSLKLIRFLPFFRIKHLQPNTWKWLTLGVRPCIIS